jgi:hypothetical protein
MEYIPTSVRVTMLQLQLVQRRRRETRDEDEREVERWRVAVEGGYKIGEVREEGDERKDDWEI